MQSKDVLQPNCNQHAKKSIESFSNWERLIDYLPGISPHFLSLLTKALFCILFRLGSPSRNSRTVFNPWYNSFWNFQSCFWLANFFSPSEPHRQTKDQTISSNFWRFYTFLAMFSKSIDTTEEGLRFFVVIHFSISITAEGFELFQLLTQSLQDLLCFKVQSLHPAVGW